MINNDVLQAIIDRFKDSDEYTRQSWMACKRSVLNEYYKTV